MALERTLSIIKPDAVAKNVIGQIYTRFENAGLKIVASRMVHLSRADAEKFYAVHAARPFFKDLVEFMISGPVVVQALEGENAILKHRDLMGATDPKKAEKGTIRYDEQSHRQPSRPRRPRACRLLRQPGREAVSRQAIAALDSPVQRRRLRRHDRSGEVLARKAQGSRRDHDARHRQRPYFQR